MHVLENTPGLEECRDLPDNQPQKSQVRRLLTLDDLVDLLRLGREKVCWLIDTGQLPPMRIAGEVRYDIA